MASTLEAFFDQYRRAFATRDDAGLLAMMHLPCLMPSGPDLVAVGDAADLGARLRKQFDRHAANGVAEARFTLLERRRLTPRFTQADVHWSFFDHSGAALGDYGVSYTLAHSHGRWRIAVLLPFEPRPSPSVDG